MSFLIKAAFWLALVIVLLPGDKGSPQGQPTVDFFQAYIAARETLDDVKGFCERRPQACGVGQAAVQTFGQKAEYGARLLHERVQEISSSPSAEPSRTVSHDELQGRVVSSDTSPIPLPYPRGRAEAQTLPSHTLNADDLKAGWKGHAAHRS